MQGLVRACAAVVLMLTAVTLTACGDEEVAQREAFVAYLQTRILDQPGLRVPKPSDEEKAGFGPYAAHYAVITDFHAAMDAGVSPKFKQAAMKGGIASVGDLVTRRGDFELARDTINEMGAALDKAKADADAAKAALEQPDEVRAVFEQAYDRSVTQSAATFRGIVPVMNTVFTDAIDLGDFIEQQGSKVSVSGGTLQVSDPAVLGEINTRLQRLQASQRDVQAAQQSMNRLISGG
jgi:hypothetical protein